MDLHILSPKGFSAAGVKAGVKASGKTDVGLLVADDAVSAAAVFTTNRVYAAPVEIGRQHIRGGKLKAIVLNSGNANACTGQQGERDALAMCVQTANLLGCESNEVLPSSTGIIGHMLPMDKVRTGIAAAQAVLGTSAEHADAFTQAILTTDTRKKVAGARVKIAGQTVTIAGICKGAGMIGPHMTLAGPPRAKQATMLAYLTTDAGATPAYLRSVLAASADVSFNAVTIDGHMSTNDTAVLLASGASNGMIKSALDKSRFEAAVAEVCKSLAQQIAADGEGATKVFTVTVKNAATKAAAVAMAKSIAGSPLVKCAIHGSDPNWGRIVSAAGYAEVPFDPAKATLKLAGVTVYKSGRPATFNPGALSKKMASIIGQDQLVAELDCRAGSHTHTIWTCDFSKEYVTINADYHT